MSELYGFLGLIFCGLIWGITDIFMKNEIETNESKSDKKGNFLIRLLKNWRWIFLYIINQTGSFLFHYFSTFVRKSIFQNNKRTWYVCNNF